MTQGNMGKTIMVTGATSGIGFHAALELAGKGAFVIGAGRDAARCDTARQRILQEYPRAQVAFLTADFSSQHQVRSLAEDVIALLIEKKLSLDVLINNAGLFSSTKKLTEDGIELTFAVNHLAPFLLTHLLLPELSASPDPRVLTVSSNSHYFTVFDPRRAANPGFYFHYWAYKVSKLSNVLFTAEFNRRNPHPKMLACAVDPGLVNTDIGFKKNGELVQFIWKQRQKKGEDPEVPVRTILRLVSDERASIDHSLYWKNSQPKPPSRAGLDPDLAYRLWEESCRLCSIKDYFSDMGD